MKGPKAPIFIDTETTDFYKDGGSEELIQFAAIKENGSLWSRFFLPKGRFSDSAVKTHGLTREVLIQQGAREFSPSDAKEILDFLGQWSLVIAHNLPFDRQIL